MFTKTNKIKTLTKSYYLFKYIKLLNLKKLLKTHTYSIQLIKLW